MPKQKNNQFEYRLNIEHTSKKCETPLLLLRSRAELAVSAIGDQAAVAGVSLGEIANANRKGGVLIEHTAA